MLLSRSPSGAKDGLSDWKVWHDAGGVSDGLPTAPLFENGYGRYLECVSA